VGSAKIVVWAHNSHLGDARATEMGDHGELNLGQLTRQSHRGETFLAGFTTYTGEVTAASEWGGPAERKLVRPALAGSYESLFHVLDVPRFLLTPMDVVDLNEPRLERAIGVVYLPGSERASHYFYARLPRQFDAVLHFDRTSALEPLDVVSEVTGEVPETYPTGV
jgi:erythromycin esterase-like protein